MNKLKELGNKYYQEVEVVMLATDQDAPYGIGNKFICLPVYEIDGRFKLNTGTVERITSLGHEWSKEHHGIIQGLGTPQHLYFLSNEEIKGGDWYCDISMKTSTYGIHKCDSQRLEAITKQFKDVAKKIIATTDTSLLKDYSEQTLNGVACLPQPSKSFIQAFIKAYNEGNPITKVLVEYDVITLNEDLSKRPVVVTNEYKLKVNSSNEITIKKVKDSWTREELESAYHYGRLNIVINIPEFNKWVQGIL